MGNAKTPALGIKTTGDGNEVKLATVLDDSAAQAAGLSSGDILLAIDGLRTTPENLDKHLSRYKAGDTIQVHAFRRDELMQFAVRLDPAPADITGPAFGLSQPGAWVRQQARAWRVWPSRA